MALREYLVVLWRKKGVVMAAVLGAVAAALAVSWLIPERYSASTTVRTPAGTGLVGGAVRADALEYLDLLQNTYAKLATNPAVVDALTRNLGLDSPPDVSVRGVPNTELMEIRVETQNPTLAARAADELARLLIARAKRQDAQADKSTDEFFRQRAAELSGEILAYRLKVQRLRPRAGASDPAAVAELQQLTGEIRIRQEALATLLSNHQQTLVFRNAQTAGLAIVSPAILPQNPSGPSRLLIILAGCLIGLISGVGTIFLFENLSERLRTRTAIQAASKAPVLAEIPRLKRANTVAAVNGGSPRNEPYRRLVASLFPRRGDRGPRKLLVTSSTVGEGKSVVVANLGVAIAQSGRSVILVDANFHAPTLHEIFGIENDGGLSEVLTGGPLQAAVHAQALPGLSVVPAGRKLDDAEPQLGSVAMEDVLDRLADLCDVVLVDSNAVLETVDPLVLVPMVDGVVLVVAEGKVDRHEVEAATEQLKRADAHLLGTVVNARRRARASGYRPRERNGATATSGGSLRD